jgi:type IV pilus assembly protein PilA
MKQVNFGRKQKGFSMIQLGVVIAITLILAALGMPKFKDYLVQGRIPTIGQDLQRYIANVVTSAGGGSTTPYTGLDQASFARDMRGTSLMTETGNSTVRHNLGGGTAGTVVVTETGDSFVLTLNSVSAAACPELATTMQRSVDDISINGTPVKVTATDKTVTTPFSAPSAKNECTDGDTNTYVFTIR